MFARYTNQVGGMVYPAIAEHLVFKKGLTFTWLGTVGHFFVIGRSLIMYQCSLLLLVSPWQSQIALSNNVPIQPIERRKWTGLCLRTFRSF